MKLTVVAQIHEAHNRELLGYIESALGDYGKAKRETWQHLKHVDKFDKSACNTHLQDKYGILKRSANSVITDVQTVANSTKQLRWVEIRNLRQKIWVIENRKIPAIKLNTPSSRSKLTALKRRLDRYKNRLTQLEHEVKTGDLKVCFGSKKLFKQDIEKFRQHRDSQLSFVGSKTETAGNQMLQIAYDKRSSQFDVALRMDWGGYKGERNARVMGRVYFTHHKAEIVNILKNGSSPLSYKIIRRNGRYYLYCTFEIDKPITSSRNNGVIGVDFNKGFLSVIETNRYGHLTKIERYRYRFRAGPKTGTDLAEAAAKIAKKGKPVVLESLDFSKKKADSRSKGYNRMLHSLAYGKFTNLMGSATARCGVELIQVNPAYTSQIAKDTLCEPMKLNIHDAAALVIAHRGVNQ